MRERRLIRALTSLLAVLGASCLSPVDVEIPAEPDAKVIVLGLVPSNGDSNRVRLYAGELAAFRGTAVTLERGATLVLIYYDRSLAELGFVQGELTRAGSGEPSRLLPRGRSARRAQIASGDPSWHLDPDSPALLAAFRLPALELGCAASGGCFVDLARDDFCTIPCPAVTPPPLPRLPEDPAPVVLGPCPAGWMTTADPSSGVSGCAPPRGAIDPACAAGHSAQFFGDGACTRIGAPCPRGDWAEGLPSTRPVLYVKAGAPPGGSGTAGAPFATIGEATARAASGTIIALNRGVFAEPVIVSAGVTLWGACVEETEISLSTAAGSGAAIKAAGLGTAIRNLRVRGGEIGVTVGPDPASIEVEGLLILGPGGRGAVVERAGSFRGRRLVIRGRTGAGLELVRGGEAGPLSDLVVEDTDGSAVRAGGGGARLSLDHARLVTNTGAALRLIGPATSGSVSDLLIDDTAGSRADGTEGYGIDASAGARLDGIRLALFQNHRAGIELRDRGTKAALSQVLIEGTLPEESTSLFGSAIEIDQAGLELDHALVRGNKDSGISIHGMGATATIAAVAISETGRNAQSARTARGLEVYRDARATVRGIAIGGTEGEGIDVREGGDLTLFDVRVRAPRIVERVSADAQGLVVLDASIRMTRAIIEDAFGRGAVFSEAKAQLTDLVIRGTVKNEYGPREESGIGLTAFHGRLRVTRGLVENSGATAVEVGGLTANVTLTDLTIKGARHQGLHVWNARTASITGMLIEDTAGYGLFVERDVLMAPPLEGGTGTVVQGATLRRNQSAQPMCIESCADAELRLRGSVAVRASDFSINGPGFSGIRLEPGAQLDLFRGEIRDQKIGIALLNASYDKRRLLNQVVLTANETPVRVFPAE